MNKEHKILRVTAKKEDVKASYGFLSKYYAFFEGKFERKAREKGLELLGVKEGENVLEIGIGTGYSLSEIAGAVGDSGRAYGLDVSPQMIELSEKRLEKKGLMERAKLYEGDAMNMPFNDNDFDAVYMAETLELFDTPDIPRVLSEIRRVLKPEGRLGVVSLSKEGHEDSLFVKFYEWLHTKIPKYASCRPIYAERSVKNAGYEIIKRDKRKLSGVFPVEILVARPRKSI